MAVVYWILFGLVAGVLTKFLMPSKATGGILMTIVVGIVGAVVGGFLGTVLGYGDVTGFDLRSLLLAVGGSALVLVIYGLANR